MRTKLFIAAILATGIGMCSVNATPHDLVNLAESPDPPVLDVRYATRLNFTGEKLYPCPVVWLQKDARLALIAVQSALRGKGMALKVFDGYRPLSVQQKMWDLVQDERYVSNPAVNQGRHTRGTAVDVALVDLMGNPLPMPSGFDDFTEKAHRDYAGASAEESANARLLEAVMTSHGFAPFATEWWHFDLQNWKSYPVLNISIEELAKGQRDHPPTK